MGSVRPPFQLVPQLDFPTTRFQSAKRHIAHLTKALDETRLALYESDMATCTAEAAAASAQSSEDSLKQRCAELTKELDATRLAVYEADMQKQSEVAAAAAKAATAEEVSKRRIEDLNHDIEASRAALAESVGQRMREL